MEGGASEGDRETKGRRQRGEGQRGNERDREEGHLLAHVEQRHFLWRRKDDGSVELTFTKTGRTSGRMKQSASLNVMLVCFTLLAARYCVTERCSSVVPGGQSMTRKSSSSPLCARSGREFMRAGVLLGTRCR